MTQKKISQRYDACSYKKKRYTENGFLEVDCYATKVGIFEYKYADGTTVRELKPAEEIFEQYAMDSFKNIPVTNDHPPVFVNPANAKQYMSGFGCSDPQRDTTDEGDYLMNRITLTDEVLINEVETGQKTEMSCGYSCWIDEAPGVWNGQHYDCVQRMIRHNHLAVVKQGRAGPDVNLKLNSKNIVQVTDSAVMVREIRCDVETDKNNSLANDKADELPLSGKIKKPEQGAENMQIKKIKLNGTEVEVAEQSAAQVEQAEAKIQEAEAQKKEFETLQGENDALKKENTDAKAEIEKLKAEKLDESKVMEIARARIGVETIAKNFLGEETKMDSFATVAEIKRAVVSKKFDGIDFAQKSDEYVAGMFDVLQKALEKNGNNPNEEFEKELGAATAKADAAGVDAVEQARIRQTERYAWKG
jgi:uncharacterized protein